VSPTARQLCAWYAAAVAVAAATANLPGILLRLPNGVHLYIQFSFLTLSK